MNKFKSEKGPLDVRNPALRVFNYILLAFSVIVILAPVYILIITSFKSDKEYIYSGLFQLPESFLNFENYRYFIVYGQLLSGFKNTLILVVVSTIFSILFGTMVAFAIGRFDFKLKKLILAAFLLAISIPSVTTQIATFSLIKGLGLFDTIYSCMLLYIGTDVMQIYIFLQFIEKIPMELDESAMVDGASYFTVYKSIILPQLKPAIATAAILKILGVYNDMFTPYLYMPGSRTVTTALMAFSSNKYSQWNVMSAGIFLILIPTIIVYLFAQKYIISGIGAGAVKA